MEEGGGIRDNMARWQTWLWLAKGISAGFYVFSRDRSGHGPNAATGPECLLPGLALAPKHPMLGVGIRHECPSPDVQTGPKFLVTCPATLQGCPMYYGQY
jgi:hypothetical protein